jgi:predicted short-subunit dehydrogenase-like oxidoreductase (DUF2520 family)
VKTISVIGPGRLGGALAIALSQAGFLIDKIVYRASQPSSILLETVTGGQNVVPFDRLDRLDSDVVLLTTADTDLNAVAASAASKIGERSVVLHTSGTLSSAVLLPVARRGIPTGSMHPLVSVSDPVRGANDFEGAFFCVEGSPAAVASAEDIIGSLGGHSFSIDTRFKPLYHASAVLASGHMVALFSVAVETLSRCGIDPSKAREILLPLVESTVSNLLRQNTPAALTGPFARVDLEAVERHLDAFDSAELDDAKSVYLGLALESLRLAGISGGDQREIGRIRNLIKLAKDSAK